MTETMTLLPHPQELYLTGGVFSIQSRGAIVFAPGQSAELIPIAGQLVEALRTDPGWSYTVSASAWAASIKLGIDPAVVPGRREAYKLSIGENEVQIIGTDPAGTFYGTLTFAQIASQSGSELPQLTILDWPDFPARGYMLDISRDKVPTMTYLYQLVDLLAAFKVNQLQLYTEHTFAYRQHEAVWRKASPMTAEEIVALDRYCRARFIDLVPNQASFGHMNRWFLHDDYLPMAETHRQVMTMWEYHFPMPMTLSPAVPQVRPFLAGLYDELLPNFSSKLFNINGDETFELGMGRTRGLIAERGKGRVYLDFLLELYRMVSERGRQMLYWGDIIGQYPALVPELPRDAIALEWGYDAGHDFPGKGAMYAEARVPFYVCPGTSVWWSVTGRTDNCMANLREAAESGLKHGAVGFLNTDWGDMEGFRHHPVVSYLGLAYGAAVSWSLKSNAALDITAALNRFVFRDLAGIMGRVVYDLGNAYQKTGVIRRDGTLFYSLYTGSLDRLRRLAHETPPETGFPSLTLKSQEALLNDSLLRDGLSAAIAAIDASIAPLNRARMLHPEADLIRREVEHTALMARHAMHRGLYQLPESPMKPAELTDELNVIESEYPALWLARARPGGLWDSMNHLHAGHSLFA